MIVVLRQLNRNGGREEKVNSHTTTFHCDFHTNLILAKSTLKSLEQDRCRLKDSVVLVASLLICWSFLCLLKHKGQKLSSETSHNNETAPSSHSVDLLWNNEQCVNQRQRKSQSSYYRASTKTSSTYKCQKSSTRPRLSYHDARIIVSSTGR